MFKATFRKTLAEKKRLEDERKASEYRKLEEQFLESIRTGKPPAKSVFDVMMEIDISAEDLPF